MTCDLFTALTYFKVNVVTRAGSISRNLTRFKIPPTTATMTIDKLLLYYLIVNSNGVNGLYKTFIPVLSTMCVVLAIYMVTMGFHHLPDIFSRVFRTTFNFERTIKKVYNCKVGVTVSRKVQQKVFSGRTNLNAATSLRTRTRNVAPYGRKLVGVLRITVSALIVYALATLTLLDSNMGDMTRTFMESLNDPTKGTITLTITNFTVTASVN